MAQRLFTALILGLILCLPARATETLRVLAWPGYADSDLVKVFEKEHQVRVEVTFVGSDDILRQKILANQGADFDVLAANTVEIRNLIARKLLVPLTLSNIPNTVTQLPRFRDAHRIAGITLPGAVYAVPYTYSDMGLIYDRKQFKTAPTSWSVMWDPRYRGRVLAYDGSTHNFSIAALSLGKYPFQIADRDFKAAIERLITLRRNVLTFYVLPEEAVDLFRRHSVAVLFANYGRQQLKLLRDAGADVGYVIPQEGALAWLDCWAVTRGARNRPLAERWINYMLESRVSHTLSARQGLSNTITADVDSRDSDRILWLESVEDDPRRADLWGRILSGDVPARF